MRCLVIIWSLILLAGTPASALVVVNRVNGPPSGFRQDFLFTFASNNVVAASGTLAGGRADLYYDSEEGELQFSAIELEDDCNAPGLCVAFGFAGLSIGADSIRVRMETPRGFYFCEPLGSAEGFCGRIIATPEFNFQAVLSGVGNGAFVRTDSPLTAIPEPAVWLSLIAGLGLVGVIVRRERRLRLHPDVSCRAAA